MYIHMYIYTYNIIPSSILLRPAPAAPQAHACIPRSTLVWPASTANVLRYDIMCL